MSGKTRCDAKADTNCADILEVALVEADRGLTWMPWMSVNHGLRKTALVIRGPKKQGNILVHFCPFCGGDVSVDNQDWRKPA
jgi:hypothetical protein